MTPLPFVENVAKVQYVWNYGSDVDVITGTYWEYTGGAPTDAEATAIAEDFYMAMSGQAAEWGNSVSLNHCIFTDLSNDTTGQGEYSATTVGTRSGARLPADACLLVSYAQPRRYRGGKPRSYLPWGVETDTATPQAWSTDFTSEAAGHVTSWRAACLASGSGGVDISSQVLVSYYSGSTGHITSDGKRGFTTPTRRTDPLVLEISGFEVDTRIASQRRRLGRS